MKMSIIRKGVILAACLTAIGAWTVTSKAASQSFKVTLNGAQQVPPVQTPATGTAELTYDPGTRVLTWTLSYSGLSGPATMAHFHGPAAAGKNGPPVIWLSPKDDDDDIDASAAIWPNWRSSGAVTIAAIVSGLAPGNCVVIWMVGKSTCGSAATGNLV